MFAGIIVIIMILRMHLLIQNLPAVRRLSDFDVEEKKARLSTDTKTSDEKELMVELDVVTIFMPSENVVNGKYLKI